MMVLAFQAHSVFGQTTKTADMKSVERGRYLAKVAGCNDCHAPRYAQTAGKVAEKQ